jgi:hypothetical protein
VALIGIAVFPVHVILAGIEYPVSLGTFLIWCVLALLGWGKADARDQNARTILAGVVLALAVMLFEGGWVLGLFLCLWAPFSQRGLAAGLRSLGLVGLVSLVVMGPWLYHMLRSGDYRPLLLRPGIHLPSAPGLEPPHWKGTGENLLVSKLSGLAGNPWWTARHAWSEFVHFWDPYPDRLASADKEFREKLHEKDPRMAVDNSLVGDLSQDVYAAGFSALLVAAAIGAMVAVRKVPASRFLVVWPIVLGACYSPFFTQMRYRIPADPAFILLGAYAVELTLTRALRTELLASFKALWGSWKRIGQKIALIQT